MEGARWLASCWIVTLVLTVNTRAAPCCVSSQVALGVTSMLQPSPVSCCGGRVQVPHWMPATILLLAAESVSWTGVVPSAASCRLLTSGPFVTIFTSNVGCSSSAVTIYTVSVRLNEGQLYILWGPTVTG